jgi:riboflavin kinase/FMN adenylyltransferase
VQRWRGLEAVPPGWGRCVATIGVFDGVHRGHQQIIGRAVERARELHRPAVVITFDPHPAEVVRPGTHPTALTTPHHKAELVEALHADVLCLLPFTLEFSRMSPKEFAHAVLVERLHAATVVVGDNFRFGHGAAGGLDSLVTLGAEFGFAAEGVPLLTENGTTISSTFVRACVDAGDVVTAARALGRPHRVEGIVVRGDARGRDIGFPTANLQTVPYAAVPADGVYAGRLIRRSGPLPAAISVGTNPTFEVRQRRVEAYVLDFEGDLYGSTLGVEFQHRLRGMEKFDDIAALVSQMRADVERTRALMG